MYKKKVPKIIILIVIFSKNYFHSELYHKVFTKMLLHVKSQSGWVSHVNKLYIALYYLKSCIVEGAKEERQECWIRWMRWLNAKSRRARMNEIYEGLREDRDSVALIALRNLSHRRTSRRSTISFWFRILSFSTQPHPRPILFFALRFRF